MSLLSENHNSWVQNIFVQSDLCAGTLSIILLNDSFLDYVFTYHIRGVFKRAVTMQNKVTHHVTNHTSATVVG